MKITGHQGARGLISGNTIAAFDKALTYKVDEIELDVRVTKDGQTILLHDPCVIGESGEQLIVDQHTFKELVMQRADAISLEAAISFINRQVPIYIEVKPGVSTKPVVAIIKDYLQRGWMIDDFRLGSYSQSVLLELHLALPDIQKIVIENWSSIRAVRRAKQVNTHRLSMLEYWLWPGFISSMTRRGYEVYSFPPKNARKEKFYAKFLLTGATNNPKRAKKWAKHGLAGVITDYPDRFKP